MNYNTVNSRIMSKLKGNNKKFNFNKPSYVVMTYGHYFKEISFEFEITKIRDIDRSIYIILL